VCAVAILNTGGGDADRQQQAQGVDQQVTLAALDLLAGVIAGVAALRRAASRLRVQHRRRGRRDAPLALAPVRAQAVVHLLEFALFAPAPKGPIDVLPRRKVLRQHPPRPARAHHVAARIDQQPAWIPRRRATAAGLIEQVPDSRPFGVRQAAGIGLLGRLTPVRLGVAVTGFSVARALDPHPSTPLDADRPQRLDQGLRMNLDTDLSGERRAQLPRRRHRLGLRQTPQHTQRLV
jgi:hypothetical protein